MSRFLLCKWKSITSIVRSQKTLRYSRMMMLSICCKQGLYRTQRSFGNPCEWVVFAYVLTEAGAVLSLKNAKAHDHST
ncbi:MAG: hypothetical protein MUC48_21720 [Leptolyngbya sp. Prado105]|nr:hypothetical protein [Leptolyngbya sp. Prado105]